MGKLRVGMLTSGGDCPGLNATIRGAAKAIYEAFGEDKVEIVGIHDGYHGLIHGVYKVMQPSVSPAYSHRAALSLAPSAPRSR